MAIRYTQNVAIEQIPFQNLPGGGPLSNPTYTGVGAAMPIQFNDSGIEIGNVREVTAIYQLQGNETVGDIINIYLAQPNSMVVPAFSSVSASPSTATTLTISVGDDDVTGYGLVSSGVAFSATPLPGTTFPGQSRHRAHRRRGTPPRCRQSARTRTPSWAARRSRTPTSSAPSPWNPSAGPRERASPVRGFRRRS